MKVTCPTCNSTRVKRSRSRSITERIMKAFHRKPYRCLDCGWRGVVSVRGYRHGQLSDVRRRDTRSPRSVPWLAIIIISLVLALILVFYMAREHDASAFSEASSPGISLKLPA